MIWLAELSLVSAGEMGRRMSMSLIVHTTQSTSEENASDRIHAAFIPRKLQSIRGYAIGK